MNKIIFCRKCNLCENQPPLLDELSDAEVVWVGLSAKQINQKHARPLCKGTVSGNIISQVEANLLPRKFYKTNLVKCLPLKNGKLRYPNKNELNDCFGNFIEEIECIKPKVVFLLGKIVSEFVIKKLGLIAVSIECLANYMVYDRDGTYYISIPHPSYVYVYKRHLVQNYITDLKTLVCCYT